MLYTMIFKSLLELYLCYFAIILPWRMFDPAFEIALPFFTEKSLFKVGSLRGTKILKKNLFKSLLFFLLLFPHGEGCGCLFEQFWIDIR